jgi:heme/copper-type cytochrome/quinol oxidase subunit 2
MAYIGLKFISPIKWGFIIIIIIIIIVIIIINIIIMIIIMIIIRKDKLTF